MQSREGVYGDNIHSGAELEISMQRNAASPYDIKIFLCSSVWGNQQPQIPRLNHKHHNQMKVAGVEVSRCLRVGSGSQRV